MVKLRPQTLPFDSIARHRARRACLGHLAHEEDPAAVAALGLDVFAVLAADHQVRAALGGGEGDGAADDEDEQPTGIGARGEGYVRDDLARLATLDI